MNAKIHPHFHKKHTFIVKFMTLDGDRLLRVIKAWTDDEARRAVSFKYLGRIDEDSITVERPIHAEAI